MEKIERYLLSGPPEIKTLIEYALKQDTQIDIADEKHKDLKEY